MKSKKQKTKMLLIIKIEIKWPVMELIVSALISVCTGDVNINASQPVPINTKIEVTACK